MEESRRFIVDCWRDLSTTPVKAPLEMTIDGVQKNFKQYMRVLYIIPTVFDYFNDIRDNALRLAESLSQLGIDVETLTVQYEKPTKQEAVETKIIAPSAKSYGTTPAVDVSKRLMEFDILHVHCPMFGAAGKVLKWKLMQPDLPMVVTVNRRVETPDFFSYLILAYNLYYLPKLFRAAGSIAFPSLAEFKKYFGRSLAKYGDKVFQVDDSMQFAGEDLTGDPNVVKLTPMERMATKYLTIYNRLIKSELN